MASVGFEPSRRRITGRLLLPSTGGTDGIRMGSDVELYRYSADVLGINASVQIVGTRELRLRDTALSIASDDDGHLDIDADVAVDINSPILQISTDNRINFRDSDIYIHSFADGSLNLIADAGVTLKVGSKMFKVTTSAIGFFGVTEQAQQAHIADPTDLAECITVLTTLLADLEGYGLLATS